MLSDINKHFRSYQFCTFIVSDFFNRPWCIPSINIQYTPLQLVQGSNFLPIWRVLPLSWLSLLKEDNAAYRGILKQNWFWYLSFAGRREQREHRVKWLICKRILSHQEVLAVPNTLTCPLQVNLSSLAWTVVIDKSSLISVVFCFENMACSIGFLSEELQ